MSANPWPKLSLEQAMIHIFYALVSAALITWIVDPPNHYVEIRTFPCVYAALLLTTCSKAFFVYRWHLFNVGVIFFLFNQWAAWALLQQYGGSSIELSRYLAKVVWCWIVAALIGALVLPVASLL